jgi:hypothetical protein
MARWAFVTVLLYMLLVVVLLIPAACLCADRLAGETTGIPDIMEAYFYWGFWPACAVVLAVQALLLLFPVAKAKGRPTPGASIWVTVITAAVLFSVLHLGLMVSLAAAIWGDDLEGQGPSAFGILGFFIAGWVLWAFIFYRFGHQYDRPTFVGTLMGWLFKGSILELLIALPCHVIVRHKDTCCAPGLTFFGISAGFVIMALAFGPGLFFLVAKRLRDIRPRCPRAIAGT